MPNDESARAHQSDAFPGELTLHPKFANSDRNRGVKAVCTSEIFAVKRNMIEENYPSKISLPRIQGG